MILGKILISKYLLNLLVQITNICQKSEFQIKFKKVLFLELGSAQVFGPAAWALPFDWPAPPNSSWALASWPARPSPSLSLTNTWAPPLHLPPPAAPPQPPSPSSRRRSATIQAPVCPESGPLCFPPPALPLDRSSKAPERPEAEFQ
jgi:hypothetical protein